MAQEKKKIPMAVQFWAFIWRNGTNQNTHLCLPIPKVKAIALSLDNNAYNLIHSPASFDWLGLIQT